MLQYMNEGAESLHGQTLLFLQKTSKGGGRKVDDRSIVTLNEIQQALIRYLRRIYLIDKLSNADDYFDSHQEIELDIKREDMIESSWIDELKEYVILLS